MSEFNPRSFDEVAETVFKSCYGAIANFALSALSEKPRKTLDLGCGGGHLGFAVRDAVGGEVSFCDINPEALTIAKERAMALGVAEGCAFAEGDATKLPFPSGCFDLVVSRGSLWFWDDLTQAIREIDRVLAPGGAAVIGGGFGSKTIASSVRATMEERERGWWERREQMKIHVEADAIEKAAREAAVADPVVTDDEQGLWLRFRRDERRPAGKLDFLGYTYCPLKDTFREKLGDLIGGAYHDEGKPFAYYAPSGCGGADPYENIWREDLDSLPDVIASVGYGDFFRKEFVESHLETKEFIAPKRTRVNRDFANLGFEDPLGQYFIYSVNPVVFLVDKKRLGNIPTPRTWADLRDPRYRGLIATGAAHGDIFTDAYLQAFVEGGEEAVAALARNVGFEAHASVMAKTTGESSEGGPGISLITLFFANAAPKRRHVSIVWPEDGAIVTPFYLIAKPKAMVEQSPIIDFVTGIEYGGISASRHFPVLNADVDNKLPPGATFKWLGWDFIREAPIEDKIELVKDIYRRNTSCV